MRHTFIPTHHPHTTPSPHPTDMTHEATLICTHLLEDGLGGKKVRAYSAGARETPAGPQKAGRQQTRPPRCTEPTTSRKEKETEEVWPKQGCNAQLDANVKNRLRARKSLSLSQLAELPHLNFAFCGQREAIRCRERQTYASLAHVVSSLSLMGIAASNRCLRHSVRARRRCVRPLQPPAIPRRQGAQARPHPALVEEVLNDIWTSWEGGGLWGAQQQPTTGRKEKGIQHP